MDYENVPSYSAETHGDILAYLDDRQNSLAQNKFEGVDSFSEIYKKGVTIPYFSSVRVADSQIPDSSLVIRTDGRLESPGATEANMSKVPAPEGVYEPKDVLEGKLWSIDSLDLRVPQHKFKFGIGGHGDILMAVNDTNHNLGYNCIERIPLAINEIYSKVAQSSIFSRVDNPFIGETYAEDDELEETLRRLRSSYSSGLGDDIDFRAKLASLGFADGFGKDRYDFSLEGFSLIWNKELRNEARDVDSKENVVTLNPGQMVGFLDQYHNFVSNESSIRRFKKNLNHCFELFDK